MEVKAFSYPGLIQAALVSEVVQVQWNLIQNTKIN